MEIPTRLKNKIRKNWQNKAELLEDIIEEIAKQFHEKNDFEHPLEGLKVANEELLVYTMARIGLTLGISKTPEEYFKKTKEIMISEL